MTQEEKAKRYDDAYKVAKNIHIFSSDLAEIKRMEEIFPELKEESEGERIRKKICKLLWDNVPYEEAQEYIAWLEKQGEQKPVIEMKTPEESLGIDSDTYNKIVDECVYGEQKHIDNVEPKFHEGEWVIDKQGIVHQISNVIENVTNHTYAYDIVGGGYFNDNTEGVKLWTIQDAKDGDILVCGKDKRPFIFKDLLDKFHPNNPVAYCGIDCSNEFFISIGTIWWTDEEVEPATKEQRDLLFQKMKETGYKWDAEKKELRKIERKFNIDDEIKTSNEESLTITKIDEKGYWSEDLFICNFDDADKWKLVEQKPAWSKEDETTKNNISHIIRQYDKISKRENQPCYYVGDCLLWMQNIKDRVLLQPNQEWSEDDERILVEMLKIFNIEKFEGYNIGENNENALKFLKSLKERVQPKQEWSEDDEVKINRIVACLENLNVADNDILLKDVDWLKSLKERVENEKDKHQ